jgi:hypothetical protein
MVRVYSNDADTNDLLAYLDDGTYTIACVELPVSELLSAAERPAETCQGFNASITKIVGKYDSKSGVLIKTE